MVSRKLVLILFIMATIIMSCSQESIPSASVPPMENRPLPTPASTLPELVDNISSNNMAVRLVSIYKLEEYGDKAKIAIPALINNLDVDDSGVRIAAVIALGHLGLNAKSATPDLVHVLHNDSDIHVRAAAADTLGLIGERNVVPELAYELFMENPYQTYDLAISCAVSISKLTEERFTDFDSTTGYAIDKDGVPLIVIDARKWWLERGQYQDWSGK